MVLKRKQSAHSVCIIPKKNTLPKKAPTKQDLCEELKLIKKLNDAMEEEIKTLEEKDKTNLEVIKNLERRLGEQEKTSFTFTETQTEVEDEDSVFICCILCIYVATCEEQLTWHMGKDHDKETNYFDTDFPCDICGKWCRSEADQAHHMRKHEAIKTEQTISCNFCSKTFESKRDMMTHKKSEHTEKVSACWDFASGNCNLGNDVCWFNHCEGLRKSEFKCNVCKQLFDNHNILMLHKKSEHTTTVKKCTNMSCWYGDMKCWFLHDLKTDDEEKKDQQITEKMFNMMEKFTERLIALENNLHDNSLQK